MGDFKFPDVGEGIQEGEIVKWLVKEGDTVKENQNIVQVETDKSVVDLPSPEAGAISIAVKEGQKVKVGQVLCTIGGSGKSSSSSSAPEKTTPAKAEKPAPAKKAEVKQEAKQEKPVEKNVPQKKGLAVVGQLEEAPEDSEVQYKSHALTMRGDVQSQKVKTSPVVRELAREHNINLAKVDGSGPDGRILKSDLSISGKVPQQIIPVTVMSTPSGGIEKIPLKGIRKVIRDNLTLSHQIPQSTEMEDVDVTRLWALREREKKKYTDVNLTLLPFIVKASIAVLKENPYLNAYLDNEAEEIIVKKFYNIGIAVETPLGLMVPNIKNADDKSIIEIAKETQELAQKSRDRTISLEEIKGGTFTITNYGSIGGTYATPLINPGESAILGTGRIFDRANPDNPAKKQKILPLSLTFDHRIIDGAQAARFLETLKLYLEDPGHLFVEI